jgi:hypothetical protein
LRATIYADPYSGWEVIHLSWLGCKCGIVYDPRSTTGPVPWISTCDHCLRRTRRDLRAPVCRHVRLLASERRLTDNAVEYDVPVLGRTRLTLQVSRASDEVKMTLRDRSRVLVVMKRGDEPRSCEGDRTLLTKIARRELDFLRSGRSADRSHVRTCARSLSKIDESSTRPCRRIDWEEICDTIEDQETSPC